MSGAFVLIEVMQPLAQPVNLDAGAGILGGIEALGTAEHLDADGVLLEVVGFAGKGLGTEVAQQRRKAR